MRVSDVLEVISIAREQLEEAVLSQILATIIDSWVYRDMHMCNINDSGKIG